jgi:hypothetical protein
MVARTKEAPMAGPQPEPRTIAGRAWLSGMRPPHRRAAAPLVASIEREAAAPYLEALRQADAVLGGLVAIDPARADGEALARLVEGAGAARELARPLLDAG